MPDGGAPRRKRLQRGCLSGAVAAQNAANGTAWHREIQAAQGRFATVTLRKAVSGDKNALAAVFGFMANSPAIFRMVGNCSPARIAPVSTACLIRSISYR
jgi:hypothetical protein